MLVAATVAGAAGFFVAGWIGAAVGIIAVAGLSLLAVALVQEPGWLALMASFTAIGVVAILATWLSGR